MSTPAERLEERKKRLLRERLFGYDDDEEDHQLKPAVRATIVHPNQDQNQITKKESKENVPLRKEEVEEEVSGAHKDTLKEDDVVPPLLDDIQDVLEAFNASSKRVQVHKLENRLGTFTGDKEPKMQELFEWHPYNVPLAHKHVRNLKTGNIEKSLVVDSAYEEQCSDNSLSLSRAMVHKSSKQLDGLKGSSTSFPFWPGGFEDEEKSRSTRPPGSDYSGRGPKDLPLIQKNLFERDLKTRVPLSFFKNDQNPISNPFPSKPEPQLIFPSGNVANLIPGGGKTLIFENKAQKEGFKFNFKVPKHAERGGSGSGHRRGASLVHKMDELDIDLTPKPEKSIKILNISQASTGPKMNALPWAVPVDISKEVVGYKEKVPKPAIEFKFELDIFQKQAVLLLEKHENVFVAAHTSAGKTVVAEYAIALAEQHMTRSIYTSPIKALSNQKFRDFKTTFPSVGLVTGDIQIDTQSSCIIMTTEILRSMLYNGSDLIRDLEWVIFDEIHYLNNEERGYVWEEVLIMLPPHVSIIMLSATVPNSLEFANWVGEIKKKQIYVISTSKRPVPLEHYLYTGSGGKSKNEQFQILSSDGIFLQKGFDAAKEAKLARMSNYQKGFGPKGGSGGGGFNENSEKTTYVGLVNHLKEIEKLPVVIFTFSRNRCDTYARLLSSVDLCSGKQKAEIHAFFHKSVGMLKGSDRHLPQILRLEEMLKNGIGVHHSGILPILKEVVEMLFQRGLVKILFATETFAMGVNMPARTVVFDSTRKHDGFSFRSLTPAEYIQMSGRAGRRGLDTTGTVIILCKQGIPDILDLKQMLLGKAAKLSSQFRLTYSMILNLLRVERITVEDIMKRSFLEAANRTLSVAQLKERLEIVESQLGELDPITDEEFRETYIRIKEFVGLKRTLNNQIHLHTNMNKLLKEGRFVIVQDLPRFTPRLGVVTSTRLVNENGFPVKYYNVLILNSKEESDGTGTPVHPSDSDFLVFLYYASPWLVDTLPEVNHQSLCPNHRIITVGGEKILDLIEHSIEFKGSIVEQDVKVRERFPKQALDHVIGIVLHLQEMTEKFYMGHIRPTIGLHKICIFKERSAMIGLAKIGEIHDGLKKRRGCDPVDKAKLRDEFRKVYHYMNLADQRDEYEFLLSPKSLQLHDEYESRIAVLRKLNYINEENMVLLKGRVACEMGSQNELMVTEMILENVTGDCSPEETAALLSCFVFEAKNVPEPDLDKDTKLAKKIKEIKGIAEGIAIVQQECGLKEPIKQYVDQFRFGLAEVVLEWAQGKPFVDIMQMTDVQEGLIVRTIQRLEEILKDVRDAGMIIGDPAIKTKMEAASQAIKRDIVFAASLYTTDT